MSTTELRSSYRGTSRSIVELMREGITDILSRRRLVRYLVRADLVKKGSDTVLGNVWWILDPLLQMVVYVVFVSIITSRQTDAYPLFIFAAILPWKWFSSSVGDAITSVTAQERIIKQLQFPKLVLPVSSVMSGIVNFAFGLIPLVGLMLLFFGKHLSPWLLAIPVIAFVQLAFSLGVALFLSAINVFFRDVGNVVRNLLRLLFYLSPSLYSAEQVLKFTEKSPALGVLFNLNPFTTLLESYRSVIYYGQQPSWIALLALLGVSLVLVLAGLAFFKRVEPAFAKVL